MALLQSSVQKVMLNILSARDLERRRIGTPTGVPCCSDEESENNSSDESDTNLAQETCRIGTEDFSTAELHEIFSDEEPG